MFVPEVLLAMEFREGVEVEFAEGDGVHNCLIDPRPPGENIAGTVRGIT